VQVIQTAAALMVRSMVLSAQSAGQQRLLFLQRAVAAGEEVGEVARLRDENRQLKWENRLLKARDADAPCRKRYSPLQRLQILWHMEYVRHEACVANLRTRWSRGRSGDAPTSPEANLAGGGQGGRSRLKPRGTRGAWSLSH